MVSDGYDFRPPEANKSLETDFKDCGFNQSDYAHLEQFKHYESLRDDLRGLVAHFMLDPSRSASRLSRHGYLEVSDMPHRYILSSKARDLLNRIGKED